VVKQEREGGGWLAGRVRLISAAIGNQRAPTAFSRITTEGTEGTEEGNGDWVLGFPGGLGLDRGCGVCGGLGERI